MDSLGVGRLVGLLQLVELDIKRSLQKERFAKQTTTIIKPIRILRKPNYPPSNHYGSPLPALTALATRLVSGRFSVHHHSSAPANQLYQSQTSAIRRLTSIPLIVLQIQHRITQGIPDCLTALQRVNPCGQARPRLSQWPSFIWMKNTREAQEPRRDGDVDKGYEWALVRVRFCFTFSSSSPPIIGVRSCQEMRRRTYEKERPNYVCGIDDLCDLRCGRTSVVSRILYREKSGDGDFYIRKGVVITESKVWKTGLESLEPRFPVSWEWCRTM